MLVYPYKFCVYAHRLQGTLIYIGKGRAPRALASTQRNSKWRDAVKNTGVFDLDILGWYESSEEAARFEKQYIKEHKPLCNLIHNGFSRKGNVVPWLASTTERAVKAYRPGANVYTLAEQHDCSPSNLYRALKRKGFKFRRGNHK